MKPKHYAEFYVRVVNELRPAVSDRSVILLDGRMSFENKQYVAATEARKRGYDGYRLCYGTFTNPTQTTVIYEV